MTRRRLGLLAAGLVLAALGGGALRGGIAPPEHRETLYVFGTLVEIVIHGRPQAEAARATADVAHLLETLHRDWHAWRPGEITALNAAIAAGRPAQVDARTAAVLRRGRELSCAAGGLFEPAIGALVGLWGFHQDAPPEGGPPDPAAVAALVAARPRMTDLRIEPLPEGGARVTAASRAPQLDFGGFAKGAALALAAEALRADGVEDAVLNAGGDVTVLGRGGSGPGAGRPWRVAIRDPFAWGAVASVEMRPGESLYTSGNYERFFEAAGVRFAHIIDPRTGRPAAEIASSTVLDTDAARADAAATALSVAGPEAWAQVAADMGVEAAMLIDGRGRVFATPAMMARMTPAGEGWPGPVAVVPLPPAATPVCPAP